MHQIFYSYNVLNIPLEIIRNKRDSKSWLFRHVDFSYHVKKPSLSDAYMSKLKLMVVNPGNV